MKIDRANYQKAIRLKFKILAGFYDLFDLVFIFNQQTNPRYVLASMIPNQKLQVLDVCVGTANSSLILAEANDQNNIVGIDLSPDMIAVAEGKAKKRGVHNLSLAQMDALKMDFPDHAFDIAMVSFGLHELSYILMVDLLKEMHRVLKPQGKLFIVDYEKENGRMKSFLLSMFLKIFEPEHIDEFLKHDWDYIFDNTGFKLNEMKKCYFSKILSAIKTRINGN